MTTIPSEATSSHRAVPVRFALVVGTTSLAFVVAQLDVTIVNIALPQIGAELVATISSLQWIVDAYTLTLAAFMLSAGALGDRCGARLVFRFGLLLFACASAGCGLSGSNLWLDASRALQGVGAAAMLPNSLALLNNAFGHAPDQRARAISWWTAAGAVSIAAGPPLGALLLLTVGWRALFWINVPLCALGFFLSSRLSETVRPKQREGLDLPGQITATLTLVLLTTAVIEWRPLGAHHPLVWGGALGGLAAGAAFLTIERRSRWPMLPLDLFANRPFCAAVGFGTAVNLTYYGTLFVLTLYLQKALGYSVLATGLAFLPLTAGFFLSNVVSGRLVIAFGSRVPMFVGAVVDLTGFALLACLGSHPSYAELLLPFLLIPGGMGLAVPAMTSTVLSSVTPTRAGRASAVLNTARQAAGALGVAAFGTLVDGDVAHIVHGLRIVALACVVVLALAALSTLFIGPTRRRLDDHPKDLKPCH